MRSDSAPVLARSRRVFMSYAHDPESETHRDQVWQLYELLRSCGIDAHLDLVAAGQRQDWSLWMADQIRAADHILVIASAKYREHAQGHSTPDLGRGVQWEARLIAAIPDRQPRPNSVCFGRSGRRPQYAESASWLYEDGCDIGTPRMTPVITLGQF